MKKNVITLVIVLIAFIISNSSYSQVGIGTLSPDKSAALDVKADTLGVLVPRITQDARDKIGNPADGLMIYNTDENCFNYYSALDVKWQSVCGKMGKATIDSVSCSGIKVFGNYIQGVETSVNERIVIPVNVAKEGSYDATIVAMYDAATGNGYTFTASGTFLYTGMQSITLTAQGTPQKANFSVPPATPVGDHIQININGTDFSVCNDFLIPVIPAAADYNVICGSAQVNGIYTMLPDQTNSDDMSHYIEVTVTVNSLGSGNAETGWSAETNKISGVQFRGSGNFSSTGPNTIRLYAISGTKPTTLDPITLTMTFQTKNGEVDCQVTLRAAYTSKKIAVFGTQNATYGYALNAGASQAFLQSLYNFGNLNNSTVKMVVPTTPAPGGFILDGAFSLKEYDTDINSTTNWNAILNTDKPDIVIITYNATGITATTAASMVQYLNKGGIILHFAEDTPAPVIAAVFGVPASTITSTRTGTAHTQLANYTDPILNGPFQPTGSKTLGGDDICGDTESSLVQVTGLPSTGILIYGYNTTSGVSCFRATGQRYCFFGEGGFFTGRLNSAFPTNGIEPFATDTQGRPMMRPVCTNYPNGAYNSFYFGNMLAWAVDQAQFYGINSGQ